MKKNLSKEQLKAFEPHFNALYRPRRDRVLVLLVTKEVKTQSGIIMAPNSNLGDDQRKKMDIMAGSSCLIVKTGPNVIEKMGDDRFQQGAICVANFHGAPQVHLSSGIYLDLDAYSIYGFYEGDESRGFLPTF